MLSLSVPENTRDPVHRAVDLDEVVRALRDGEHVEGLAAGAQPEFEPARPLDIDVDRTAVQLDLVPAGAAPGYPKPVGLTAHPDIDLVLRLVPDLGTPALGGGEQPALLTSCVRLVGLEGGGQQGEPPAAMCSCSLTMSTPVVASVTGCSTCSRVLTSRNDSSRWLGS